jgi:hypothetical protein
MLKKMQPLKPPLSASIGYRINLQVPSAGKDVFIFSQPADRQATQLKKT